jgi:hypothetical protein
MKIDQNKLIELKARAMALDRSIAEQKEMLERGILEPARYAALSTDYNRQHIQILLTLKAELAGTDERIDDVLAGAIDGTGDDDEMAEALKQVAEDKGLGKRIVETISKKRGTIISWVVDIGLAIGKAIV